MENRPIRVPPPSHPDTRFFNQGASTGLSLGILASLPSRSWAGALALPAVGLIAGSIYGKDKAAREHHEGQLIHPPTYLNRHAFENMVTGILIGSLIGIFTGGSGLLLTSAFGFGFGGAGSVMGHKDMTNRYQAAQKYVMRYGEFNPHAQHTAHAQPQLTPQEAQMLRAHMQQNGFVARLADEAPSTETQR